MIILTLPTLVLAQAACFIWLVSSCHCPQNVLIESVGVWGGGGGGGGAQQVCCLLGMSPGHGTKQSMKLRKASSIKHGRVPHKGGNTL